MLFRGSNGHQTPIRAGQTAPHEDEVLLREYLDDVEVLNRPLLATHMARHLLALHYATGFLAVPIGTTSPVSHGTVARGTSGKSVALHDALKSAALAGSHHIDAIADLELPYRQGLPWLVFRARSIPELLKNPDRINPGLREVAKASLRQATFFLGSKTNLDCVVPVGFDRFDLGHATRTRLDDGHRLETIGGIKDLRHADLFSDQDKTHI